jgi:putative methionine-R-sulfoxide reductase with GAF domain
MMKTKTNKPRGARSLRTTLAIAFFTLSVVVLVVNGSLALYTNYLTYQEALSARQLLIAHEASKTIANSIEEKFTGLETAVEFANPVSAASGIRENIVASMLGIHPAFRQFALIDGGGGQLAQVSRVSQSLSPQFTLQLKGDSLTQTAQGQRYISPVYFDEGTSEPLVAIAIPVKNVLGDIQGALVAEVNLKFMWDLVDQIRVGETGYAYVVDNQGNLIAFGDTSRVLANENVGQIAEVKEYVENSSTAGDVTPELVSYTGLTGKTVVGTYLPLGSPEWAIFTELPTAEATQRLIQGIISSVATILVLAALAGVAGVFLARRLAAPLVDLSNTANEIAGGNLAMQAKVAGAAEIAQVASAFNAMTSRLRDLIGSLEQRVAERTRAIELASDVSRRLSTILDPQQLASEVVELLQFAFSYYYVQIYLFDEPKEKLVMAGGTGEAGKLLLQRHHSLPRGAGLVGQACDTASIILVSDTARHPNWLPNPLLPDTRAEIAVPILMGSEVLGALDVQQDRVNGLDEQDVSTLQSVANQVAIALRNARQYADARRRAQREAQIGTIIQQIQGTQTIESALQVAARELGRAVGASRTGVRLNTPLREQVKGQDANALLGEGE